jgi:hypothetical protein
MRPEMGSLGIGTSRQEKIIALKRGDEPLIRQESSYLLSAMKRGEKKGLTRRG